MMERLQQRAGEIGARRAALQRDAVAERILAEVPGVTVSIEQDEVVVAGRKLGWRAVTEPALRWIGSMFR